MPPEDRWERADRLFLEALDLAPDERQSFLDRECSDDEERRLVERLVSDADTGELSLPGGDVLEFLPDDPPEIEESWIGRIVGRFRIVNEIGRGGMAVVYLAERADGEFVQRVAVKLIKRGIDTDEVIRRFSRERQMLASVNHPNIARLIDGGTTDDGRPYFVMEHVEGQPIDRFCDERRMSASERLRLFEQVAEAVAYAHRNLIVHRDLKPSNVLVTADGSAKLLDFGIAGTLETSGGAPDPTATGRRFLTPTWASPEQIRGASVTTASDVYQLGLLLYRLLTGRSPYRTDVTDPDSLKRAICVEPATRPSTAVRERAPVAETGEVGSGLPAAALFGDLDNILLMALRKEPERRYSSVGQFIEDIERYLHDQPVVARADTLGYRMAKFMRRNRLAVGAAAVVGLLLVGFSVVTAVQSRQVSRERDVARTERERAEEVVDLLVGMFETGDPTIDPGGDAQTVGQLLEESETGVLEELADQPEVATRMKHVLGKMYLARTRFDRARELLREALDQQRALGGENDPVAAEIFHDLALVERTTRGAESEPLLRESLELQRRVFGDEHERVARALQDLAVAVEEPGEKLALMKRALAMRRALLPEFHPDIAASLNELAGYHHGRQDFDDAARLYVESLDILTRVKGADHPHVLTLTQNLASTYMWLRDWERAEQLIRETIRLQRVIVGEDSMVVATGLNNLGSVLAAQKNWEDAVKTLEEAVDVYRRVLGPHHAKVANTLRNIGMIELFRGRDREALGFMDQAVVSQQGFDGRESVGSCHLRAQRAEIWTNLDRAAEARDALVEIVRMLESVTPDGSRELADSQIALGRALLATGEPRRAEDYYRRALDYRRARLGEDHPWVGEAEGGVGLALASLAQPAEAEPLLRRGFERFRSFEFANPVVVEELRRGLDSVAAVLDESGAREDRRPAR